MQRNLLEEVGEVLENVPEIPEEVVVMLEEFPVVLEVCRHNRVLDGLRWSLRGCESGPGEGFSGP